MGSQVDDAPFQIVEPSADEKRRGALTPLSLSRALEAMHQDGLVVLRGVVDVEHVDALNAKMCEDARVWMADPATEHNHSVKSNFLQRPPLTDKTCLFEDVYFNPFVLQVLNSYLGHRPAWNWLTANTAMAGTAGLRQPVHKDCAFAHPLFPYFCIANIPLCDFSVDNGATEFWLGSHAHTSFRDNRVATTPDDLVGGYCRPGQPLPAIHDAALAARRALRPPLQPALRRGDIALRDLRLWHAGMPNTSDRHRIMLGLGYMSPAHPNYAMRLHLPASQQEFFLSGCRDAAHPVELRANVYADDELAKLKIDSFFDLRPTYLE